MSTAGKKKVLIIGAGASGMSCADQLAKNPDKFDVTVVEAVDYCGGQAFSIPLNEERHGASWLNQGVQGGSYIFRHTFHMFHQQGFKASPVHLQVSFGKDDVFWSNVFPTELVGKHKSEIKRFNYVLKIVRRLELFFIFMPVWVLMKMFFFSKEFTDQMIMPTLALFLGTGNATPEVSAVILERLFTSPTYGMWYNEDRSNDTFCSNLPPMVVFPDFSKFYGTWEKDLISKGVKIRLSTEVTRIIKRSKAGVTVAIKKRTPKDDGGHNPADGISPSHNPQNVDQDKPEMIEEYDELVFACLADTAKALLGKSASLREKVVLGSTKWSDDITVTHWDSDYMERKYVNKFAEGQKRSIEVFNGKNQQHRLETAKEFSPMYYIRCYPEDSTKLEMAFDCSNYQYQFPKHDNHNDDRLQQSSLPLDRHVFQTIFLNNSRDSHLWPIDEIDKSKIIRQDWWHQLCHSWTHYALVVPWMWLLNARKSKSTRYAGSWTLVNAHEMAVISGLAAAWSLGAGYPEELQGGPEEKVEEERWRGFGLLCFRLYCLIAYGKWYSKGS